MGRKTSIPLVGAKCLSSLAVGKFPAELVTNDSSRLSGYLETMGKSVVKVVGKYEIGATLGEGTFGKYVQVVRKCGSWWTIA